MSRMKHALLRATALAAIFWGSNAAAQAPDAAPATEPPVAEDGMGEGVDAAPPPPPEPPPPPAAPVAAPTISDAIAGGKLLLEVRARYEDVDQKRTAVLRERGEA